MCINIIRNAIRIDRSQFMHKIKNVNVFNNIIRSVIGSVFFNKIRFANRSTKINIIRSASIKMIRSVCIKINRSVNRSVCPIISRSAIRSACITLIRSVCIKINRSVIRSVCTNISRSVSRSVCINIIKMVIKIVLINIKECDWKCVYAKKN